MLLKRGKLKHPPFFLKSNMSQGFLIVICIIIAFALILFPLIVSYNAQKNKKK